MVALAYILAFGRQRQEDQKFKAILSYIAAEAAWPAECCEMWQRGWAGEELKSRLEVMGKHGRQHTKIQKGEEGNEKVRTGANLTHSPGLSVQTKVYWLLNVTLIVCSRTCSRTKSSVAWKESSMLTLPLCYINYRILNMYLILFKNLYL